MHQVKQVLRFCIQGVARKELDAVPCLFFVVANYQALLTVDVWGLEQAAQLNEITEVEIGASDLRLGKLSISQSRTLRARLRMVARPARRRAKTNLPLGTEYFVCFFCSRLCEKSVGSSVASPCSCSSSDQMFRYVALDEYIATLDKPPFNI